MNWLLDDLWLQNTMRWFVPPPPKLMFHANNSSMTSFFDYVNPIVDRLSPTDSGDNLLDYYGAYTNRASRHLNSLKANRITKTFHYEYITLNCLGKGGFGQVYDGRRRSNNNPVVIKFLPKNRILNWSILDNKNIPSEIEILSRLRGVAGIIRIIEYFEEPDRFIFTMEKIPSSCTLFQFVMESSPLPNTELLRHIFRELIRINIILQSYSIWHRDCKLENILYCKSDRTLHFIDFGSAAPAQLDDFHEFQGTLEIMVPEWISQRRYDGERSCVWALGICLYFLLFQQYPFRSKAAILGGRSQLPFTSSVDKQAYHTMKQCLHLNEHRRPKLGNLQYLSWLD
ncbi:unnamed protein product [Adineta steineri]|uniref:non-specific serine/threonine protein kinase n=1 Tax=Adineta steineri TaxID=433720 RepID=A0A814GVA3_9BILA|nr:unnamed protein product [Adineta steineri]CAF1303144.1 unnamed protein product [Adineta steineri]CAF1304195.1 unnamed protein product [Adineta steineri]